METQGCKCCPVFCDTGDTYTSVTPTPEPDRAVHGEPIDEETLGESLYTMSIYHWRMSNEFPTDEQHNLLFIYPLLITRDDAHDEDEDNEDEEEEEEHLAPASSTIVVPVDEPTSISLPPEAEVERLLAMTSPSPSPPVSLSPPSTGERLARCTTPPAHLSPPPMPSPLLPSSGCPTQIQTLRIASTQALIDAVTAVLPSPPLPLLPLYLYIQLPVDHRDEIPESEQPPRKRLYLSTLGSRTVDAEERRQGIRDVGYSIRDTWVDPAEAVPEIAPMTLREVNTRVTELAELHEHDTQDLYALLEDAQDIRMVEEEAYASREAWAHSIRLSQATHKELQTHRDHVYTHETYLQAHQTQLQLQGTLIQTQHQQRRARQPGPEARIPDHQDASGDADNGSHSSHGDNRRNVQTARPCFYADFMKCQPLNFKGTEGVVGLTRWIEKMESVFNISGCAIENQVKFATCTLLGTALTWWNGQIRTLGPEAYAMTWEVLKKKMTDKYCPQGESNLMGDPAQMHKSPSTTMPVAPKMPQMKANRAFLLRDWKEYVVIQMFAILEGNGAAPKGNGCFECGAPGNFKRDCPKLKNRDGGNGNAQGWVYAVGNA
ncbi:putative reverse transcriptase domain-containing protein [Tanacetum coccineum]